MSLPCTKHCKVSLFREKASVLTTATKALCDPIPHFPSGMRCCFCGLSGGRMFQAETTPWSKGPAAGARLVTMESTESLLRVPTVFQNRPQSRPAFRKCGLTQPSEDSGVMWRGTCALESHRLASTLVVPLTNYNASAEPPLFPLGKWGQQ